jgi:protein-tyrosine phosphatase
MPYGPYDPGNSLIREYRRKGVQIAVPLVTDEEVARKAARNIYRVYEKEGIEVFRFTIPDLTSPTMEHVTKSVSQVVEAVQSGKRVVVHCNAGLGRTGVVLACVRAQVERCTGEEAIAFIKQFLNLNMTDEQIRFVKKWAAAAG